MTERCEDFVIETGMPATSISKARKLLAQVYPHRKFRAVGPEQIAEWNAVVCDVVRKCIIDTGSACHLVGKIVSQAEKEEIYRARAELAKEIASLKTEICEIEERLSSKISKITAEGTQKTVEDFEADTETIKKLTSWFKVASLYLNKSIPPAEK